MVRGGVLWCESSDSVERSQDETDEIVAQLYFNEPFGPQTALD